MRTRTSAKLLHETNKTAYLFLSKTINSAIILFNVLKKEVMICNYCPLIVVAHMNKRHKINVWNEKPTDQNVNAYFAKTITLYNKGEYEESLVGFEKLSEFINADLTIIFIPHIENCRRIKRIPLSNNDKLHLENQAVLRSFGWIDSLKYFTAIVSFISFSLFTRDSEYRAIFLITSVVFGVLSFLIHKFMRKYTISKDFIRCKSCGTYNNAVEGHLPTFGLGTSYNCIKCCREYPMPDFYRDGWEGLRRLNNLTVGSAKLTNKTSGPDEQFYKEYAELKTKYSKEYNLYKERKDEIDKKMATFGLTCPENMYPVL
ncbi:MAG: hypothetical protein K4571_17620 [Deltaproteobacteria bacterium]